MLRYKNQKGISLILTLVMMLLIAILIMGLSKLGSSTSYFHSYNLNATKAEYAAQAGAKIGLQYALQKINASEAAFFSNIISPSPSPLSGYMTATDNKISYSYTISAVDKTTTPRPNIIGIASTGIANQTVTRNANVFIKITTFNPANVLTGAHYSKVVDLKDHSLTNSYAWGSDPTQYTSHTSTQTKVSPPIKEDLAVTFNDPQSLDNGFSLSYTGQCAIGANSGNSGYAILYGLSATSTDGTYADPNNLNGYMFQYDPGADKFFVKKLLERDITPGRNNKPSTGYAKLPQDNTYYEKYPLDRSGKAIMDINETAASGNTTGGYTNDLDHDGNDALKLDYHYAFQPNNGEKEVTWVNLCVAQKESSPNMNELIRDFDWTAQHTIQISILSGATDQAPTQVIYCDGVEILRFIDHTPSALKSFKYTRSGLRLWNTDANFIYQLSSTVTKYQWAPTNSPPPNL